MGLDIASFIYNFIVKACIKMQGQITGNNVASSYIYVLTFTHIFHLLAGMIVLLVGLFQAYKKKYHSENLHGLKLSVRFWHFLTVLWVYIFLFLLLIN